MDESGPSGGHETPLQQTFDLRHWNSNGSTELQVSKPPLSDP